MKHGFIGFGNLAKAVHQGLKSNKEHSFAYTSKSNSFAEIQSFENLSQLTSFADVIWLCVKPQNLTEVLTQLKNIDLKNKIIISPVAGKSIGVIENYLGKNVTIVRIMPNLAIAYKKSVIAYCANAKHHRLLKSLKKDLLTLGKVVELQEGHYDLFTAIFGSGPAFLLAILQTLKNKISELGISDQEANDLLIELIIGTTTYFQKNCTKKSIDDLIKNVTSKGGTTEAGLNYIKKNNLNKLFENVIIEAQKKSKEMNT
ncbi:MAG: pyrroline-5-carboxylate reductase dimerization domain-containing protein [Parcubacteria group bacterium]|jgi:pyrroline-5-carboxylate reductase